MHGNTERSMILRSYVYLQCLGILIWSRISSIFAFTCPPQVGNYADPADCEYFYQCGPTGASRLRCAYGTYYNPAYGSCNVFQCPQTMIPPSTTTTSSVLTSTSVLTSPQTTTVTAAGTTTYGTTTGGTTRTSSTNASLFSINATQSTLFSSSYLNESTTSVSINNQLTGSLEMIRDPQKIRELEMYLEHFKSSWREHKTEAPYSGVLGSFAIFIIIGIITAIILLDISNIVKEIHRIRRNYLYVWRKICHKTRKKTKRRSTLHQEQSVQNDEQLQKVEDTDEHMELFIINIDHGPRQDELQNFGDNYDLSNISYDKQFPDKLLIEEI